MDAVKGSDGQNVKRPDKRAERSRRTREKIVAAARELFVAQGYGATSLQEIADRAGVAVQTVYFVFRNKRALFKDVVDMSIAGDVEPVATMDRDWFRAACAEPTAAGQLRAHVRGVRDILGRVAPIMPLIAAAAATDPEIAAQWPMRPRPALYRPARRSEGPDLQARRPPRRRHRPRRRPAVRASQPGAVPDLCPRPGLVPRRLGRVDLRGPDCPPLH